MNLIFIFSIFAKGIGAALELLLQILITRTLGLGIYGTYATCISVGDLIFWIFFSGFIKLNTFYLSHNDKHITGFKNKFIRLYVLPVLGVFVCLLSLFFSLEMGFCLAAIALFQFLCLEKSSFMLAKSQYLSSVTCEYIIGRLFLIIMVFTAHILGVLNLNFLMLAYVLQYLAIYIVLNMLSAMHQQSFHFKAFPFQKAGSLFQGKGPSLQKEGSLHLNSSRKDSVLMNSNPVHSGLTDSKKGEDISPDVSLKKLKQLQKSDMEMSLINQVPVILQYFAAGPLSSGVVGIVLLVKKLIFFVSGPTSKVFLPEFSRLYHEGDLSGLKKVFSNLVVLQMLFLGPLLLAIMGFPNVVLSVLADDLVEFKDLFIICSVVFVFGVSLGPCAGILQMTENEVSDNRIREFSILVMVVTMAICFKHPLFSLFGLCIQTIIENGLRYLKVCRIFHGSPIQLKSYLSMWSIPLVLMLIIHGFHISQSFFSLLVFGLFGFVLEFLYFCFTQNLKGKTIFPLFSKQHDRKTV